MDFDPNDLPEVGLGDPPAPKPGRGRRWTLGRVATGLLLATFGASSALALLAGPIRGACGHTPERDAATISGLILLARPAWRLLKAMNDVGERRIDAWTRPETPCPPRTP